MTARTLRTCCPSRGAPALPGKQVRAMNRGGQMWRVPVLTVPRSHSVGTHREQAPLTCPVLPQGPRAVASGRQGDLHSMSNTESCGTRTKRTRQASPCQPELSSDPSCGARPLLPGVLGSICDSGLQQEGARDPPGPRRASGHQSRCRAGEEPAALTGPARGQRASLAASPVTHGCWGPSPWLSAQQFNPGASGLGGAVGGGLCSQPRAGRGALPSTCRPRAVAGCPGPLWRRAAATAVLLWGAPCSRGSHVTLRGHPERSPSSGMSEQPSEAPPGT